MMHRIRMLHIIHIIRWSQHILTIVSRCLFCRSCSESCGGRPLFQRVSTCVSLASVSCFQQPLHPSFTPPLSPTLFHHPLHNHYASISPFRFWVLHFCACHCRHHHTVVVIIVHILNHPHFISHNNTMTCLLPPSSTKRSSTTPNKWSLSKECIDDDLQKMYNASVALTTIQKQRRQSYVRQSSSLHHSDHSDHSDTPETDAHHRLPHHCGAIAACVLMWWCIWCLFTMVWSWTIPMVTMVGESVIHTVNGEVAVTCKMGDLPLNHLRCMLFLRITHWLHWSIAGMSKYLSGLENPCDMFCFLCTALGGLYMTCATMVRSLGGWLIRTGYRATIQVYRGTFKSLNNPMSPFGYIESSLTLSSSSSS